MKKLIYCLPLLLLLAACSKSENKAAKEVSGSYQAQIHCHSYWVRNISEHGESNTDYTASVQITNAGSGSITVAYPDPSGGSTNVILHLDQNTADSLIYSNSSSYGQFDSDNARLRFGKAIKHFTFSHEKKYRVTSWNTITYTIQGQP
ncbi:hypothetical protein [Taibaiella helva]|uniref:hypothetical protein n=1 Tax=Taibaiella helva TaxID=2301235 RepID=UPI000E577A90|nr:hypothetical protein [Taibaiella helva]